MVIIFMSRAFLFQFTFCCVAHFDSNNSLDLILSPSPLGKEDRITHHYMNFALTYQLYNSNQQNGEYLLRLFVKPSHYLYLIQKNIPL
jgi:hypothetical protein